jgi:hypothetical protein
LAAEFIRLAVVVVDRPFFAAEALTRLVALSTARITESIFSSSVSLSFRESLASLVGLRFLLDDREILEEALPFELIGVLIGSLSESD